MPRVLAEFVPIYCQMGALGWAQHETDLMDVAVCARFLGIGPNGDGTYPLVIRGSRSLYLPKDADGPGSGDALAHVTSVSGDDRRAAYKQAGTG